MRKLYILLFAFCLFTQANAIVDQKVNLKNGTVLNGFILNQDRKGHIQFESESAVICMSGDNVVITDRTYRENELNKNWKEWADKNKAWSGSGNNKTLVLSDIILNSNSIEPDTAAEDPEIKKKYEGFESVFRNEHASLSKVMVLERGKNLKFVVLSPLTNKLMWSDINTITSPRRDNCMLSGINRTYQMKNGQSLTGQYAGETYNTLSLYKENGTIETIDINNVVRYTYEKINPNQSLLEQSQLLDVVNVKNKNSYKGIIVERNFSPTNDYLVIETENGSKQTIKFKDIDYYSKVVNTKYKGLTDIILKPGEIVVCRTTIPMVGVNKESSRLTLDKSDNLKEIETKTANNTIEVEYNNDGTKSAESLLLVKLDRSTNKKKTVYSFSSDLFEMKQIPHSNPVTSVNNTTRIEYTINNPGTYCLYDMTSKKAMPFIVKHAAK